MVSHPSNKNSWDYFIGKLKKYLSECRLLIHSFFLSCSAWSVKMPSAFLLSILQLWECVTICCCVESHLQVTKSLNFFYLKTVFQEIKLLSDFWEFDGLTLCVQQLPLYYFTWFKMWATITLIDELNSHLVSLPNSSFKCISISEILSAIKVKLKKYACAFYSSSLQGKVAVRGKIPSRLGSYRPILTS